MELMATILAGLGGVALGAALARRNYKQAATERLLAEALDDVGGAIADAANDVSGAQARYASGLYRVALHGSPQVVSAFSRFQRNATTVTSAGRTLLVGAMQEARRSLGHEEIEEDELAVLLFGADPPSGDPRPTLD